MGAALQPGGRCEPCATCAIRHHLRPTPTPALVPHPPPPPPQVRELIYREILEYHPQMLADYLAGGHRQPNFVYPSAGAAGWPVLAGGRGRVEGAGSLQLGGGLE